MALPAALVHRYSHGSITFAIPRYYTSGVMLAPEYNAPSSSLGGLGSLASSFGVNLGNLSSEDAITPTFYPDLISSTMFLTSLLNANVATQDGKFQGTYLQYLSTYQKEPVWSGPLKAAVSWFKPLPPPLNPSATYRIDPLRPNRSEELILKAASKSITCNIDTKTSVISLTTTAQDPLVAAQLAKIVQNQLQDFIIEYRTKKARTDLEYINKLLEKSKKEYSAAQKAYADYVDAHNDITLQSYINRQEQLENELQAAFNNYDALQKRKQMAEAKVQERTPAFTTIQNIVVPVKHAGPKRMIITLIGFTLAFVFTTIVFLIQEQRRHRNNCVSN